MSKFRIFGVLLAMAWCGGAWAQSIGGQYAVEGTNANGAPYHGTAEIVVTSENTCRITWKVGSVSNGICMRNADSFAAGYVLNGAVGLIIYRLKADGSMQGLWTIADQAGVGTETLTPIH